MCQGRGQGAISPQFLSSFFTQTEKPDFKTSRRITLIEIGSAVYLLPNKTDGMTWRITGDLSQEWSAKLTTSSQWKIIVITGQQVFFYIPILRKIDLICRSQIPIQNITSFL